MNGRLNTWFAAVLAAEVEVQGSPSLAEAGTDPRRGTCRGRHLQSTLIVYAPPSYYCYPDP